MKPENAIIPGIEKNNIQGEKKVKRSFLKRILFNKWIFLALVVWIILAIRPLFHPYILEAWKYKGFFVLSLLLIYISYRVIRSKAAIVLKIVVPFVFIGLPCLFFFVLDGKTYYHQLYMMHILKQMDKKEITVLPYTIKERVQTRNNIQTMGQRVPGENVKVGMPHLLSSIYLDSLQDVWTMPIEPSMDTWQRLFGNINGILVGEAHKAAPKLEKGREDVVFNTGENMKFDKNVYNAAIKALGLRYFNTEPDDVYYLKTEKGKWVQVVSLIEWTGILFPVPKFGGVIIIEEGDISFGQSILRTIVGQGKYVSPENISHYKYLDGQDVFSEKISRIYAESFTYLYGYDKAEMSKLKAIEIPQLANDQNRYPFRSHFDWSGTNVNAKNGIYGYIGLEPIKEENKSLALSIFIPPNGSGTIYYYDHAKAKEGLQGVTAMPDIAKTIEKYQNLDWTRYTYAEARPYLPNIPELRKEGQGDGFFWIGSIVTMSNDSTTKQSDGSVIAKLVAISAAGGHKIIALDADNPDNWIHQVRAAYDLPSLVPPKVDTIRKQLFIQYDTIPQPARVIPIVQPEKKDTVKPIITTPIVIAPKVDTVKPVVKQQNPKAKQKLKTKKEKG